jgi:predicted nucleotidyltransferase
MKIAGIVSEYNPFHNGHKLHIQKTRAAGFDKIVCVMNGHLSQRGDLTPASKWTRARAALLNGADAVAELPALFGCRTADKFADAGIRLIAALGADAVSFGSESGALSALNRLADAREDEPPELRAHISDALARGETLARARGRAEAALGLGGAEARPNDILAVEYLRALRRLGECAPQAFTIPRTNDYHSTETGDIASATAVRGAVSRGDLEAAARGLPESARFQAREMAARHGADDLFLHALRSLGAAGIARLPDVAEGLENRAARAAAEASDLADFIARVKCKRYTYARIARLAAHALVGLTAALAESYAHPRYVRLIGARADAGDLLSEIARRSTLPILQATALSGDPCFALECRVTDIWALTRDHPAERRADREFTEKFVKM